MSPATYTSVPIAGESAADNTTPSTAPKLLSSDRASNVVLYGINECHPGCARLLYLSYLLL